MNEKAIIMSLVLAAVALFAFAVHILRAKRVLECNLAQMSNDLCRIMDENTDEKVMVFTDNKTLIELIAQINRMLENRQRIKMDYRKSELSSKRMLSNISHDIKTPMTVILGYLEIMRLKSGNDIKMLSKVENKAGQVLELINKFFSLAKLEAGDADVPVSRINLNEACKRNILDFYDILKSHEFLVLAAVMQSAFIVDAYRNKTMDLMFQYPIHRKKIILSKILAVLIFCFIALIMCKYFIYGILYLGSFCFTPDFSIDAINFLSPAFHATVALQELSTVWMSILTLYIGLLLKSTKASIITAFILFAVTQGGFGNFSLANNKIFFFIIIGISILCFFLCIARIEAKDVDGGKVS